MAGAGLPGEPGEELRVACGLERRATPQQIADACLEAAEAGAAITHIHVRDPETGQGSRDPALYAEVVERVRQRNSDVILNLTAGMGGDLVVDDAEPSRPGAGSDLVDAATRLEHIELLKPEICTLDCGTMNFGDGNSVVVQTPNILRAMARRIRELGVKPEMEVFDTGHLWFAKQLVAEGVLAPDVGAGLAGFEWAVGVPGSIGGAVRMNAGGHGSDIAANLVSIRAVDLAGGDHIEVPAAALDLRYRSSNVAATTVVTEATLALTPGDQARSEAELAEIVRWRRENQPGGANAGSVFTNPANDHAGRLIDRAGCRGLRIGTAEVSPKHANFLQADPGGSADDIFTLMAEVQRRVRSSTGVELHPELRMVGFDDPRPPVEGEEVEG